MKDTPYWWEDTQPGTPPSALPARVDAAMIGAGYTALSTPLTLAQAGRSVVVLDTGAPASARARAMTACVAPG